jgi:hypothetical protein
MRGTSKIAIIAVSILVGAFALNVLLKRSSEGPKNRHVWMLPNGERIEYYETKPKDSGFVSNISQNVRWTSEKRGVCSGEVGIGGSFGAVTLWLDKGRTVAWITGVDSGGGKPSYLGVLDVANFKLVGGESMWASESHISSLEKSLRSEVEQAASTAIQVQELK